MDEQGAKNLLQQVGEEKIKSVLDRTTWKADLAGLMSANQACQLLETSGATSCDDLDTNGWDHDFWLHFTYGADRYLLSGSGWYGHLSFELLLGEDEEV